MQYFFRTSDVRREGRRSLAPLVRRLYPDVACAALGQAIDQAKQAVLESDKTLMLQSVPVPGNKNGVQTMVSLLDWTNVACLTSERLDRSLSS